MSCSPWRSGAGEPIAVRPRCRRLHAEARFGSLTTARISARGAVHRARMDLAATRSPRMRRSSIALAVALLFVSAFSAARDLPVVDPGVRAGDAFFQYVNGAWLKATEIPPDRSSMGDDVVLNELNNQRTLDILE